ncbi:hypothetical protein [Brevibacillus sp. BC25]|uniref:hypothetical protein n=1 Tax=Brevibacillus sp. BC25 TaxID=1144308 RepID=UPI00027103E5|nr:hypothetical protein [Brevibacillus sp. BC25]EJL26533.1 hypothetical protein PMI05_03175 [Brevibacillus sp. BC25]
MTNEQKAILEKFGFRIEGEEVKHLKLGIVRNKKEFVSHATSEELQDYIKSILRNQCQWRRGVSE